MSELGDKREIFTKCLCLLLTYMLNKGYRPRLGKDGQVHMVNSLHYQGLAADIDLFNKDNIYLTDTQDHKECGEYWKTLHPDCRWGGDFTKQADGNHYSVTFAGRS
jgi:hypothetical protein